MPALTIFLILFFRIAPARAADSFESCREECSPVGQGAQPGRQSCVELCDKKFPEKSAQFCPELEPCKAQCSANFPKPNPAHTQGSPWVACNGACLQKYLRFGCEPLAPPREGGGSGNAEDTSKLSGAGSGGEAIAARGSALSAQSKSVTEPIAVHAPPPRESVGPKAIEGPGANMTNLGLINYKRIDSKKLDPLSPTTPLEALVQSAVKSESEPTLFERVSRKYRELTPPPRASVL